MRRRLLGGPAAGLVASLAVPQLALADTLEAAGNGALGDDRSPINTLWVIVAGSW